MTQIKVSANSVPKKVAAAIANIVQNEGSAEGTCIGAGAVNQAAKAVAIASGFAAPSGIELVTKISFGTVEINNEDRSFVRFTCLSR